MKVEILVLGPLDTNTYILSKDGKCIIIDPADDAEKIISFCSKYEVEEIMLLIIILIILVHLKN